MSVHLFAVGRSRYVPSRGATYAEETSDIRKRIDMKAKPGIVAKNWQSVILSHAMTARRPRYSEKRVKDR